MRDDYLRDRLASQQGDSATVIEGPRTLYRAVSPHDKGVVILQSGLPISGF
jgi:hypothetical protein